MQFLIVEPDAIPGLWEWMRGLLAKAIERDTRTIEDVHEGLLSGMFRAFVIRGEVEGVIVAALNGTALRVCYVGGRIEPPIRARIETLLRAVENVARQAGCTEVICSGRAGWGRFLAGYDREMEDGMPTFRKALTWRT